MNTYYRATITIPKTLYRRAKTQAALHQTSMSGFITDILERMTDRAPHRRAPLPFGKYRLRKTGAVRRTTLYDAHLRRTVPR